MQDIFLCGFYTNNVSARLDATSPSIEGTNDLTKSKNGIKLKGIRIISDKKRILPDAMSRAYEQVLGKKNDNFVTYIEEINQAERQDIPEEPEKKFQSFVEMLQNRKIKGNEATQTLIIFEHLGFFQSRIKKSFIGEYITQDGTYRRKIVLQIGTSTYLLDTDTLECVIADLDTIKQKITKGEYIYEDKLHTIENSFGGTKDGNRSGQSYR